MSNVKRTVKIKESDLINLVHNIVNEGVELKKQEWINEEAKKTSDKTSVLESKIAKLEAKFRLLEGKK